VFLNYKWNKFGWTIVNPEFPFCTTWQENLKLTFGASKDCTIPHNSLHNWSFFPAQFAFKIWNNFFSHTLLEGQLGGNTFNFEIQVRGEIKLITVFITVFSQWNASLFEPGVNQSFIHYLIIILKAYYNSNINSLRVLIYESTWETGHLFEARRLIEKIRSIHYRFSSIGHTGIKSRKHKVTCS